MKREIKFRAWVLSKQKMVNVYGFNRDIVYGESPDSPEFGNNIFERSDVVLLQYTGCKDVENKRIHEGDIVYSSVLHPSICRVIFKKGKFCLADIKSKKGATISMYSVREFKRIGNIYENPELLK